MSSHMFLQAVKVQVSLDAQAALVAALRGRRGLRARRLAGALLLTVLFFYGLCMLFVRLVRAVRGLLVRVPVGLDFVRFNVFLVRAGFHITWKEVSRYSAVVMKRDGQIRS